MFNMTSSRLLLSIMASTVALSLGGCLSDADLSLCEARGEQVNWDALLWADCPNLSDYNLFADDSNPTTGANSGGLPYDLNTQLFTDYASKYRFVFVPEAKIANYSAQEVMDFPVGTVISKTFALPANTSDRGIDKEDMVETRLLIHRVTGWSTLPYIYNAEKSDAVLAKAGAILGKQIIHNGEMLNFDYVVPSIAQCKQCHQFTAGTDTPVDIIPIGPKARHLNKDYVYDDGTMNQLMKWQSAGILQGVPELATIDTVPAYSDGDESGLPELSDDALMKTAKGYLDINCAHCHRPEGYAKNTGLTLEYWRPYGDGFAHGTCKPPAFYDGGSLTYDVVPGSPDSSILHFRIDTNTPGDRMPIIGRSLIHGEGVALIHEWIRRLPLASCSPS